MAGDNQETAKRRITTAPASAAALEQFADQTLDSAMDHMTARSGMLTQRASWHRHAT
jgi:hypothetical protein